MASQESCVSSYSLRVNILILGQAATSLRSPGCQADVRANKQDTKVKKKVYIFFCSVISSN